jgi:mRNA interferase RelE/StbE
MRSESPLRGAPEVDIVEEIEGCQEPCGGTAAAGTSARRDADTAHRRSNASSRPSGKALRRIDRRTAERIVLKIEQLARDPDSLSNNVTAMKGGEGLMRLRVGDWRVIYRNGVIVNVVKIAPRGSAYE